MLPSGIIITTQATQQNWRHLAAVARTYRRNPVLESERFGRALRQIAAGGDPVRGGSGSGRDVALFGASHLRQLEQHGLYTEQALDALSEMEDAAVRAALEDLTRDDWTAYERKVTDFERTSPRSLVNLLAALSGVAALLDPDGTLPTLTLDGSAPGPWTVNPRHHIPEWRRQLVTRLDAPETAEATAREMPPQQLTVIYPQDRYPGLDHAGRARLLCQEERDRLSAARLIFAGADTAAVATRKASRPRKTPLDPARVPSRSGFLVFARPIDYAPGMAPLVAASWSTEEAAGEPPSWFITLYVHNNSSPPLAPIAFERLRAGDVLADRYAAQDTGQFAARAVVACWDLITQERVGKAVVDVAEEKRKPVKQRADRRRGITDDGTVQLVDIRGRQASTPRPRQESDAIGAGPARHYDRGQWWVQEHTRDHCMNPAQHRDGGCTHQDITILDYPKGPQDKPFLETVYVLRADAE